MGFVQADTTDESRGVNHRVWLNLLKRILRRVQVEQIKLSAPRRDDVSISSDRREMLTDESATAEHKEFFS